MPSDFDTLVDMGFEKARIELAVKKTGGLQGALQWLEDNQDKSLEDVQTEEAEKAKDDKDEDDDTKAQIAELESGQQAKSLICNECGKRFRNPDLASYHATKTEHTDFSESTEELAPLTEEEKKAKLESLREKLAAKRAAQSVLDKEEHKRNEKIRQKSTKETQEAKEELQRKEQIKEAARKKQEKLDDMAAKKQIKDRIEADKAERRRKAEEAKAAREGRVAETIAAVSTPAASAPKPKANHTEARLRLQTSGGNLTKTVPAETTLMELAQMVEGEVGQTVSSFTTTFPRKVFSGVDFGQTVKEAGLVPSGVLIVG